MKKDIPTNVDTYIAAFPVAVQNQLNLLRQCIQQAAPQAQECIKYAMPCYVLNGNLVYFAAYKTHIGFYSTGDGRFAQALASYKTGKGSVQFPLDKPLPLDLIAKIVAFRVQQNTSKL